MAIRSGGIACAGPSSEKVGNAVGDQLVALSGVSATGKHHDGDLSRQEFLNNESIAMKDAFRGDRQPAQRVPAVNVRAGIVDGEAHVTAANDRIEEAGQRGFQVPQVLGVGRICFQGHVTIDAALGLDVEGREDRAVVNVVDEDARVIEERVTHAVSLVSVAVHVNDLVVCRDQRCAPQRVDRQRDITVDGETLALVGRRVVIAALEVDAQVAEEGLAGSEDCSGGGPAHGAQDVEVGDPSGNPADWRDLQRPGEINGFLQFLEIRRSVNTQEIFAGDRAGGPQGCAARIAPKLSVQGAVGAAVFPRVERMQALKAVETDVVVARVDDVRANDKFSGRCGQRSS